MTQQTQIKPSILKNPIHFLAFGFGVGLFPKAPGTLGTLIAIPFFIALSYLTLPYYLLLVLLLALLAIWICQKSSQHLGIHDYQGIVLDEMIGYWVTMAGFPPHLFWIVFGFILFRLFDVWKPWPISWIQKKVKGGLGIVLDDIIAALFAWTALWMIQRFFHPIGSMSV